VRRTETISILPSQADLQLLFARLNYQHFDGDVPGCPIAYNERFSNSAGRTNYGTRPATIELSPKHFRKYPDALEETLLHEMIHVWCFARFGEMGHGARFRRKLRECGMQSIYHDLGTVRPLRESNKRYVLRCEHCAFELLRKRKPARPVSCARCNKRRYDARFPLSVYEVVELRLLGEASAGRAAMSGSPCDENPGASHPFRAR
jgi:predicted SprT family Zn-dependent metalloprotease